MKFRFVWIGKTKDKNWLALQNEYFGRLSYFVKCEITEIKEVQASDLAVEQGKKILQAVGNASLVVLLDVKGKQISSHKLAEKIEKWQMASHKEIIFIIGGAEGVSPLVAERADLMLSLSILTFTHDMTRVLLLEQLYRAYSILKGFPYQK